MTPVCCSLQNYIKSTHYYYYYWQNPLHRIGSYAGMPPVCLDTPICLDAPICLDTLHVLMMFGCPLYIHNTKKACIVRQRGCPYAPIHLDVPYVWMPPVGLDDVWMPAVHIQHIKECFVRKMGCSYASHTFVYLICLDAPCMFG